MLPWFRAYHEALDDPKVQRLPGDLFKTWFNLLCVAARHAGVLPAVPDLAFLLRLSEADTAARIETLIGAGLVDRIEGRLCPHNWGGRQYESDDSSPRVKKHRENKKAKLAAAAPCDAETEPPPCNGEASVTETPSESESESETDSDSSSVVVPFTRASPTTTDDEEILFERISQALSGRVDGATARAGVRIAQGWIREGCDLEADILPELRVIGNKLSRPLKTFAAPWLREQIMARSRQRAAARRAATAPPAGGLRFVAEGTPEWRARVAAGHVATLNHARSPNPGDARRGWYFPADGPAAAAPVGAVS